MWFSVARCFAADSSCVTHSRNRFCVLADLWLRFELRAATICFSFLQFSRREPSGFCLEVFCRRTFFNPGKRHISAPPEMRRNAEISMAAESSHPCGANWHNKNAGKVFLRGCYTMPSKQVLPNCPPPPHYILLILSYLELKVYLEREIEREERKIYLVKGLHLVKRSISSKERAGGCRPPHPPLVKKSKVRLKLLT